MDYQQIIYTVANGIATITMNRPERMNAMTSTMANELKHAMETANQDITVRTVILTGAGRGFCSGADAENMGANSQYNKIPGTGTVSEGLDLSNGYDAKYAFISTVAKPVIAAINGPAVGAGLLIALHCDIRFAAKDAKLSTIFAKRGLVTEYAMAWMLSRLIGPAKALDISMSARVFLAEEALTMGLVERAVEAKDLMPQVYDYAKSLVENVSPRSTRIIKQMIYKALDQDIEEAVADAQIHMAETKKSNDYNEGIQAWKEKRTPNFTGT